MSKSHLGGVGDGLNATKECFKIPLAICLALVEAPFIFHLMWEKSLISLDEAFIGCDFFLISIAKRCS